MKQLKIDDTAGGRRALRQGAAAGARSRRRDRRRRRQNHGGREESRRARRLSRDHRDHEDTDSTKTTHGFASSWFRGVCAPARACAKHYTTDRASSCKSISPGSTVTISHDAFPGFMDAMAMPFDLKGGAQRVALTAGDRVKLRLAVKGGRSWVDRLDVDFRRARRRRPGADAGHACARAGRRADAGLRAHRSDRGAACAVRAQRQGRRRHLHLLALPAARLLSRGWWRTSARFAQRFADADGSRSRAADDQLRSAVRHARRCWRNMPRRCAPAVRAGIS